MAKWTCYRLPCGNFNVVFLNCFTGAEEILGQLRQDTGDDIVLDWVVAQNARAQDIVTLPSGRVVVMSTEIGLC